MATALLVPDQTSLDSGNASSHAKRSFDFAGGRMFIHADSHDTLGAFALIEVNGKAGGEPPLHVHTREDELFYVLEGELTVQRGYETIVLLAGQSGFLPRNVPHTFKITSGTARWLVYVTPGGFEEYFRTLAAMFAEGSSVAAAAKAYERMAAIAARHGASFLK